MTAAPPRRTRTALAWTAAALLAATTALTGGEGSVGPLRTAVSFDTPLVVPPLAEVTTAADGTRVFDLTADAGTTELVPGKPTETWGFNGSYLGPTLRARVGERVRVDVTNALEEATSVHWHGMHLPAEMDGGPHQMIEPGETWSPTWRVDQEAATLWYHPHPHGSTEEHVYRGLTGFFLLDPARDDAVARALPHTYGHDDFPVAVQDKRLDEGGGLVLDDTGNEMGLMGNVVLANGVAGAHLEVRTELTRLRLLNGSTARVYDFGLDDGREFAMVASDGGLLERPLTLDRIQLSPGERAEIVVRMRPDETLRLRSYGAELGGVAAPGPFGGNDVVDVLELRSAPDLEPSAPLPAELGAVERLDASDADAERTFVLEGREINGRRMDMGRVDEAVTLGSTEVWEVLNRNLFPHNFHVHDVQFQVVSIDGEAPPPELAGWKDTVYLPPRRTFRLVMRFTDYADADSPYMFHCHLLRHEDEGMMGQFVVLEEGDEPGDPPVRHEH